MLPETIVLFCSFRKVNKPLQSDCIAIAYAKIFSSKEVNASYLIVVLIHDDSPQNPQSVVGNQPLAISQTNNLQSARPSASFFIRLSAGGADNLTPFLIRPSWCSLSPHHHNRLSILRKYGSILHCIKSTIRGLSFLDFLVAK